MAAECSGETRNEARQDDGTMMKIAGILMVLAAFAVGCARAGAATVSEADTCTQSGGAWRLTLGTCDRSSGGGGGY